jgi:hypothetical protein
MSIGYQEVSVSPEKLKKLKRDLDEASGPKKYGRFKAWLHFANLDSWQKQGHHFHYLTDVSESSRKLLCTCGLYVEGELDESFAISNSLAFKLSEFLLDRVQTAKGHRDLGDFRSPTCALIIDFKWEEKLGDYLWTAYCQECGEVIVESRNEVAKKFVQDHNSKCLVRYE